MGHGEQEHRLRTRTGRKPPVRFRSGVRQPDIDDAHLRPGIHAFDDTLRMWIEIMTGFQVRREHQNELGIGMVRRGTICAGPECIPHPSRGRADIRMGVVCIDPPGPQDSIHVAVGPGPPHVVHDLVMTILQQCRTHATCKVIEHLVPAHPFELSRASLPYSLQRIQDPFRVIDLVERGRSLCAISTTGPGVMRVSLEFPYGK